MGAKVSRTDFEWVYTEEPHASRRKIILAMILTILVCYVSLIEAEKIRYMPDLLTEVLKKYDEYKNQSNDNLEDFRKSNKHSDIEDTIRAKIAEIAPLLDDKKRNDHKNEDFHEVNKTGSKFPVLRPDVDNETLFKNDTDDCDGIVICSEELLDFLTEFYDQLNVSYSEVFKNYQSMYLKEIDADAGDEKTFLDVLKDNQEHVNMEIKTMFTTELGKLNEVFNVSSTRIDALKHVIDRTIHNAKDLIYTSLSIKLRKLKPKLRLTVKQDVGAGIKLGNLKKEFKDKMCSVFRQCNGYANFRKYDKSHQVENVDPNSLKLRFGQGNDPFKLQKNNDYNIYKRNDPKFKDINKLSARRNKVLSYDIKDFKGMKVTYADYVEKGPIKKVHISSKKNTNATVPVYLWGGGPGVSTHI